jgi:Uncharacterized protein conserved in bacteria C-term(DUF2220)
MTPDAALASTLARRILAKAIDRFDGLGPEERKKALRISLNAVTAPEIFQAESSTDRELAWHVLEVLEAEGVGTLRFGRAPRHGAREERKPAFEIALSSANEERLREFYGRARPGPTYGQQWRDLVEASAISTAAKTALAASPIVVEGRPAVAVLDRLLSIRELDRADSPLFLREVSSRVFWGISKILDGRGDLVAAMLDKDECPFAEQPVHLCVDVRGEFEQMLFIENKTTFERCIAAADEGAGSPLPFARMALVFASGFMGSARRLRTPSGSRLFFNRDSSCRTSSTDAFTSAFYSGADVATTFWGDLDYAGMTILTRLRAIFPSATAWQPGYRPMVSRLEAGEGHLPGEARKGGQRPIVSTGCVFADDVLLPALAKYGRFLDQE